MYDLAGCLVLIILALLALALLKELWWLIVGIALIFIAAYWGKRIYMLLAGKMLQDNEYKPQTGEVYKICPYCGAKARAGETVCKKCRRPLN